MKTFRTPLLIKSQIANQSWAYYFEKPKNFKYSAGQYCKITLINPIESDIKGNTRSFSFASTPNENELMIVIRLRDSSFKKSLHALTLGEDVEMLAPLTMMSLKGQNTRPLIFLCGGIGVAAARSIVLDALSKGFTQDIHLFNSNNSPERTVFLKEFKDLEREFQNFHYIPTVTGKNIANNSWNGELGYITPGLIEKYTNNTSNPVYYIAGPSKFVWAMYKVAQGMGVKDNNINFDEFTGY